MHNVTFDSGFVEEATFLMVKTFEKNGKQELAKSFFQKREQVYAGSLDHEREEAFRTFYESMFTKVGLRSFFQGIFADFPLVGGCHLQIFLRRVWDKKHEGSELYYDGNEKTVLLTIQANRAEDLPLFESFLRHELFHISDMLDPAFSYDPHPALGTENELEERLICDRFRILWNLYVDARLLARKKRPLKILVVHRKDFDRGFSQWSSDEREKVFQKIVEAKALKQSCLLNWARDERLDLTVGQGGILCPLCRFTTFEPITNWTGEGYAVAQAIWADYPDWNTGKGVCRQCFDLYHAKAGVA